MKINLFSYSKSLWNIRSISNERFKVIYSRDSVPKWMFSVKSKTPLFLETYNGKGVFSFIIKSTIKILFRIRLANLVLGKYFSPGFSLNPEILKIIGDYKITDYGIFFGTIGVTRKIIFVMKSESGKVYFSKYYTTENSKKLIQNESKSLIDLKNNNNLKFKVPIILESSNSMILIESVIEKFKPINFDSKEINYFTIERPFKENLFFSKSLKNIFAEKDLAYVINSNDKLQILVSNYLFNNRNTNYFLSSAHGDFTPWNVFITKERKVIILDWELSRNLPLFYDYFHFKIQSLIMLEKHKPDYILNKLNLNFLIKKLPKLCEIDIEVFDYLILYLISTMTFYVPIYKKEESLHWQGKKALIAWKEILTKLLKNENYYRKYYK